MKFAQSLQSRRAVAVSLGILLALAALGDPKLAMAQQRPLKKVHIVVATPVPQRHVLAAHTSDNARILARRRL